MVSTVANALEPRAAAITVAPPDASEMAMARPIPREAPVTRATRPVNINMTVCLVHHKRRSFSQRVAQSRDHAAFGQTCGQRDPVPHGARLRSAMRHEHQTVHAQERRPAVL